MVNSLHLVSLLCASNNKAMPSLWLEKQWIPWEGQLLSDKVGYIKSLAKRSNSRELPCKHSLYLVEWIGRSTQVSMMAPPYSASYLVHFRTCMLPYIVFLQCMQFQPHYWWTLVAAVHVVMYTFRTVIPHCLLLFLLYWNHSSKKSRSLAQDSTIPTFTAIVTRGLWLVGGP